MFSRVAVCNRCVPNMNLEQVLVQVPVQDLLLQNFQGGRNQCIIYCAPFRITKTTLIGYLAKTGQDQHFKLNPQSHVLLYKVFFDKKQSKLPMQIFVAGSHLGLPRHHFFLISPSSKCKTENCPAKKKGDFSNKNQINH